MEEFHAMVDAVDGAAAAVDLHTEGSEDVSVGPTIRSSYVWFPHHLKDEFSRIEDPPASAHLRYRDDDAWMVFQYYNDSERPLYRIKLKGDREMKDTVEAELNKNEVLEDNISLQHHWKNVPRHALEDIEHHVKRYLASR